MAVAALISGCGTASSTSPSSSTTAGGSTNTTSGFDPNLVPAGGSSPGTLPKQKKSDKKSGKSGKGAKHPSDSAKGSNNSSPAPSGSGSGSGGASGGGGQAAAPSPGVTRTVTVTHTATVTVTKTRRPDVPAGAGLPSTAAPLYVSRFDTAGGTIGCRILGSTVRCDLARRNWTAPRRPASCHAAWAQGLMIGSSGMAFFVCARNSVLDPTVRYIRPGYDDKVGPVTCQIRSFGVTCFESDHRGFFISRTGYIRF